MYKVCIYNNDIETVIHYPTADQEAPHLDKLPLKEGLSLVDSLSFSLYPNNPGYNSIFELTTKVKVIDTRDNSIRFTGRVLNIDEKMDSSGSFYKEVLCEGALSYLNDTKTRNETFLGSPSDFIQWILNKHNAKVEDAKKMNIGDIDIAGSVAYTCNFKSTLESLLEVKEKIGGDIRVRENNGVLYLDWLHEFSSDTIDIQLGLNMKEMIKHKDITSLGTRIIPLGANNLTIESINGELDYIEDINAATVYGVLEKAVEYREITDPIELYNKALEDLPNHTQPLYMLEAGALDLSFITGNNAEQFVLGSNLHILNQIMAVDNVYKIVALDLDLLKAYDPKLTIANFPVKLTSAINDLRKASVQNNGVYNSVQVGDAFGIRAVRSDGKVITTVNATEGISIENQNKKVFYVDSNGVLRAIEGIFDDITANNMIANEMRTSNTSSYIVFHDQYAEFFKNGRLIMRLGFDPANAYPSVVFYNDAGQSNGFTISGSGELIPLGDVSFDSPVNFYSTAKINDDSIATRNWVMQYVSENMPSSTP